MRIILFLFLLAAAAFAWWWRARGGREEKDLVAKENHRSVRKFHYGPPLVPDRLAAAPPLAPNDLLSQLLPEEDFKAREDQDVEAEANRVEAEQMAEREAASGSAPVVAAAEERPKSGPAIAEEPKAAPAATSTPGLLSSRHAPGATVDVHDLIASQKPGADEPVVSEPEADGPVAGLPGAAPALVAAVDEGVAEALYDNPVSPTSAAPTKNDAANRQAAVGLRQRKRVALQARLDTQKTAMSALATEKNR